MKIFIEKKIPLNKNLFGVNKIPIEDKYGKTKEVVVIRGVIENHQISIAKSSGDYSTYTSILLSLTMKIPETKTFIMRANDFENFIEFNDEDSYEIIFIDDFMRIKKIS